MKQSETVKLGEAIASLWDEDPDMYEQLLVHRMMGYLPEVLGNLYRWVVAQPSPKRTAGADQ